MIVKKQDHGLSQQIYKMNGADYSVKPTKV